MAAATSVFLGGASGNRRAVRARRCREGKSVMAATALIAGQGPAAVVPRRAFRWTRPRVKGHPWNG